MSKLTQALEEIMNWLQKYQPEFAASFLPGITYDEIQAVEQEIEFKLSEEIYELYQWRNGTGKYYKVLFFPSIQFLPFKEAFIISQAVSLNNNPEEGYFYKNNPIFTFVFEENDGCATPLEKIKHEKSPVLHFFGEEPELVICYDSITSMMQTFAECYKTGVYYLDEEGFICENEDKAEQIWLKYNGELNNKALHDFESLFKQKFDFSRTELLGEVAGILAIICRFKDPKGVDLLLKALTTWANAEGFCRDGLVGLVINALGDMRNSKAIEPIEKALQDNSFHVKQKAKEALAKLK